MVSQEYTIDGSGDVPEEPKPRLTFTEDDHKNLSEMSVGDKMSMLVSGRICSMSEGYGKDKKLQADMEIDKMSDMKMMGNKDKMMDKEGKDGKDN